MKLSDLKPSRRFKKEEEKSWKGNGFRSWDHGRIWQ